jgi:hypothetical protein
VSRRGRPGGGPANRHARTGAGAPPRRHESGAISLIEVVLCTTLLAVLGAVVFPLVSSFSRESASIQDTYTAVDQLLEPTQILARYLHEATAAAPEGTTSDGQPVWSVFTVATASELQFTADVGTYGTTSDAGSFTAYGPALVTVSVTTGPDHQPELVGTLQPALQNTCPATGSSGSVCQWSSATRPLFAVTDLSDGTSVFQYLISDALSSAPSTSCSVPPGSCPLDRITAVAYAIDTQNTPGLPGGTQSEAFLLAPAYSAAVG